MISDEIYPQGNQNDWIKFMICLDSNTSRFTVTHKNQNWNYPFKNFEV